MTAQPIDPFADETTAEYMNFERLCSKFGTDRRRLSDPQHRVTMRAWLTAMSVAFPRAERPQVDWDFRAYTGDAQPIIMTGNAPIAPVLHITPAVAPVAPQPTTVETVTASVEPVETTDRAKNVPTMETWQAGHTQVHADVFRNYTVEQALAIYIIRRHISDRGDLYIDPVVLAARLSISVKTLKMWVSPGGVLSAEAWLRKDDDGAWLDWTVDGAERWRIDVRKINLAKATDAEGNVTKTLDTPADAFVRIPHTWVYIYPGDTEGDRWARIDRTRRVFVKKTGKTITSDDTASAVWAAAVLQAEGSTNGGVLKAVHYITSDWGRGCGSETCDPTRLCKGCVKGKRCPKCGCKGCKNKARTVQRYLDAAEDAGLIKVANRTGKKAAWRSSQWTPTTETTTHTRKANGPAPTQPVSLVKVVAPGSQELPF